MEPVLSIRQLTKVYGKKQVLKQINLDVFPGQIIGYIGPNGAGKSTTVKILAGLITDYGGEVMVFGRNLRENLIESKSITGYVPEMAEMYDLLSPREYLTFIGKLHHLPEELIQTRSEEMMTLFGMRENMEQRMDGFSKGMKQKVLLSSGLLHDPKIIILDEPLSGLDANAVIVVKDLLQKLKGAGKTIFYCSHMMDVVEKVSDRIVLINEGVIVADGTFASLRGEDEASLEQIFARITMPKKGDNSEL